MLSENSLLEDLRIAEQEYVQAKYEVEYKKAQLYVHTDWKELKITNQKERDCWVIIQSDKKIVETGLRSKQTLYNHLKRMFEWEVSKQNTAPLSDKALDNLCEYVVEQIKGIEV